MLSEDTQTDATKHITTPHPCVLLPCRCPDHKLFNALNQHQWHSKKKY